MHYERRAMKVEGSENINQDGEIRKSFKMKVTLSWLFIHRKYFSGQILKYSSVLLFILQMFPVHILQDLV